MKYIIELKVKNAYIYMLTTRSEFIPKQKLNVNFSPARLKSELGEEVLGAAGLLVGLGDVSELVLEEGLGRLSGLLNLVGGQEILREHLLQVEVHRVSGGHDVSVVVGLDEGLDAGSLLKGLLTHTGDNLTGVSVNASNDGVAVLALALGVIRSLDDDGLAAGESATEDNNNLTGLETIFKLDREERERKRDRVRIWV